ncbi:hypothetical protein [Burkholderia gladioli]|uniref:hypothetical protein n=1 Tax=Burkholderia gladioli TaxID=28095 RepID=UPI0016413AA4|nr:hypothetical protein [Burkholderia gladioli]
MSIHYITTRIVLHKDDERTKEHSPDASEYKTLHEEMHARGYRRFFVTDSGNMRKLPPGEYHIEIESDDASNATEIARDRAKAAATKATSEERYSLLTTGPNSVKSVNLPLITEDPDDA